MKLAFWRADEAEERASPENPSTNLSNPASWLVDMLGGGPTASGKQVTPETALRFNTVYACITLIAETIAQMPLVLYRRTSNGREIVADHPAARAIRNPSPWLTPYRLKELQTGHALSWGNGWSHIVRNGAGYPVGFEPLMPNCTTASLVSGDLVVHTMRNGVRVDVSPDDVLHLPAFGTDGIVGISPIRAHAETIGAAIAARDFGATFFGNSTSVGTVLTAPKSLGAEGRNKLREQWERLKGNGYQGTAVLEDGIKPERLGIPPEEAQFIETRKLSRSEIASIYKVPPHMVGDLDKATFSNITEQSIQYLRYTMMPWVIKWEEELNRKLLMPSEQGEFFFKFTVQGLLRGTQAERYQAYNTGIQAGFLSRNEVREWEELNPVDGLSEFLEPMNMQPAGQEPDGDPQPDEPDADPDPDGRRLLFGAIKPMVARSCEAIASMGSNAMVRMLKRGESGFEQRAREWLAAEATIATIQRYVEPIGEVFGDADLSEDFRTAFTEMWTGAIRAANNNFQDIQVIHRDIWLKFFEDRYTEPTS